MKSVPLVLITRGALVLFIVTVALVVLHQTIPGIVSALCFAGFLYAWMRRIVEDLIVHSIRLSGGNLERDTLIRKSIGAAQALDRLAKRRVIVLEGTTVRLLDPAYRCAFKGCQDAK